jgi:alkylation response protein AidB-like acyl-CoA dehydrogenase
VDFSYSPEEEKFRQDVRAWLEANLPKGWGTPDFKAPSNEQEEREFGRWWHQKMHQGGWVGIGWPKQYGGRGATLMEQVVFHEEWARHRAPAPLNNIGIGWAGPTIIAHGTEEQKNRFIPKILSAEEIWCQGFSEPEAGSDLASLRTRAVDKGDHFLINGQKVWTTGGKDADWGILMVRTDPDAPKHRGISYLLINMHSPGVTVRPLRQISGTAEFGEWFLDDVKVPKDNLLGQLNMGWYIGMTTLAFERSGTASVARFTSLLHEMIALAKKTGRYGRPASKDPVIRQRLAQFAIEVEIMRYTGYRNLTTQLRGGIPGPESSIGKLYWSEMNVRAANIPMQILGPYSLLGRRSQHSVDEGRWLYLFLRAPGDTIMEGTSEIQRNIIGERALGLPR